MSEFEPGQLVTLEWARGYYREAAPIFILLHKNPCNQTADAYCMYDPTENDWLGQTFTLTAESIIRFNP